MSNVDVGLADYLKAPSLFTTSTPVGVAWGDRGFAFEISTPIDQRTPAIGAANRFAGFMGAPLVKDEVEFLGGREDLLGKVVGVTGDRLGYTSTPTPVFVIGVAESLNGTTIATVLRRLGPFVANPDIPTDLSAVTYGGEPVTYDGEPVRFAA